MRDENQLSAAIITTTITTYTTAMMREKDEVEEKEATEARVILRGWSTTPNSRHHNQHQRHQRWPPPPPRCLSHNHHLLHFGRCRRRWRLLPTSPFLFLLPQCGFSRSIYRSPLPHLANLLLVPPLQLLLLLLLASLSLSSIHECHALPAAATTEAAPHQKVMTPNHHHQQPHHYSIISSSSVSKAPAITAAASPPPTTIQQLDKNRTKSARRQAKNSTTIDSSAVAALAQDSAGNDDATVTAGDCPAKLIAQCTCTRLRNHPIVGGGSVSGGYHHHRLGIFCDEAPSLEAVVESIASSFSSTSMQAPLHTLLIANTPIPVLSGDSFPAELHVQKLYLINNSLSQIEENAFGEAMLNALEELEISCNQLTSIPYAGLSQLRAMRSLDLNSNAISTVEPYTFLYFRSRDSLENLELAANQLEQLHSESLLGLESLKRLSFDKNYLKTMPMQTLRPVAATLEELCLSVNEINYVGGPTEASNEEKNASSSKDSGKPLILPKLKSLSLEANRIAYVEPEFFEQTPALYHLFLGHNMLTSIGADMLQAVPSLRTLAMSENKIAKLEKKIFDHTPSLTSLDLSDNLITHIEEGTFQKISSARYISLARNRLSTISSTMFSASLPLLIALDLSGNTIFRVEDYAFHQLPSLQMLNLASNRIEHLSANTFHRTFSGGGGDSAAVDQQQRKQQRVAKALYLHDNPLACDVDLAWLVTWLRELSDIQITKPGSKKASCASPSVLKGISLREVDLSLLVEAGHVEEIQQQQQKQLLILQQRKWPKEHEQQQRWDGLDSLSSTTRSRLGETTASSSSTSSSHLAETANILLPKEAKNRTQDRQKSGAVILSATTSSELNFAIMLLVVLASLISAILLALFFFKLLLFTTTSRGRAPQILNFRNCGTLYQHHQQLRPSPSHSECIGSREQHRYLGGVGGDQRHHGLRQGSASPPTANSTLRFEPGFINSSPEMERSTTTTTSWRLGQRAAANTNPMAASGIAGPGPHNSGEGGVVGDDDPRIRRQLPLPFMLFYGDSAEEEEWRRRSAAGGGTQARSVESYWKF